MNFEGERGIHGRRNAEWAWLAARRRRRERERERGGRCNSSEMHGTSAEGYRCKSHVPAKLMRVELRELP